MDMQYLKEFVVFTRFMNFSKAAKALHLSQPTLSNHIAAIESEVGCTLVSRGNPLRLNYAGRVFLEGVSTVIDSYERTLETTRAASAEERCLTVAFSSSANSAGCTAAKAINEFLAHYPTVSYNQTDTDAGTAHETLTQGGADAVMVTLTPLESDIAAGVRFKKLVPAFPNRLLVWMHASNPLAGKATLHWRDLAGSRFPMNIAVELWAAAVMQILKNHDVSFETSIVTMPGMSFALAYEKDDLIMMDEMLAANPMLQDQGHRFKALDEPDAVCDAYFAYLPDNVSPSLQLLLDFLDAEGLSDNA